jgi:hypothetical protein
MSQHLEALKLSVSLAKFAVLERYNELTGDTSPIEFRRVTSMSTYNHVDIADWEKMHETHWNTYFKASDDYILSLNMHDKTKAEIILGWFRDITEREHLLLKKKHGHHLNMIELYTKEFEGK